MKNSRSFIIISYYTKNTGYELEVQNLITSLEKFNLPYHIEAIDDLGSWQKNTQYKVEFIQKCLDKFKKPVVFIDADAVVEQDPTLFDNIEEDIGVHYRYITSACKKLLSGTVYVNYTPEAYCLLHEWKRFNQVNPVILEQCNLAFAIGDRRGKGLTVNELPASYCNIFDLMNVKDAVITHYQASRRLK